MYQVGRGKSTFERWHEALQQQQQRHQQRFLMQVQHHRRRHHHHHRIEILIIHKTHKAFYSGRLSVSHLLVSYSQAECTFRARKCIKVCCAFINFRPCYSLCQHLNSSSSRCFCFTPTRAADAVVLPPGVVRLGASPPA